MEDGRCEFERGNIGGCEWRRRVLAADGPAGKARGGLHGEVVEEELAKMVMVMLSRCSETRWFYRMGIVEALLQVQRA
jgi:hypothetical protein